MRNTNSLSTPLLRGVLKLVFHGIFIQLSIEKWGNIYDYSKVNYIDSNNKVIIICKKHGEFEQIPPNHLKYGCGSCGREKNKRNLDLKETCKKEFISKANNIHQNIYDYSKSVYENAVTKLIVICKTHGDFSISPNNHLRGKGCAMCGRECSRLAKLKDFDEYKPEFIKLYGEKYDYSSVVWEGGSKFITVICKKHGEFHIPFIFHFGAYAPK